MNIVIIAHNIRSTHNVGAILRTADGFGITVVYCTGYTPYPALKDDDRLPHIRNKISGQIHKTALGAEQSVPLIHSAAIEPVISNLKSTGFEIVALEQTADSVLLPNFQPQTGKVALLLGEEVHGTPASLLAQCDTVVEIPMKGAKESFNVSVAAGIAMYSLSVM